MALGAGVAVAPTASAVIPIEYEEPTTGGPIEVNDPDGDGYGIGYAKIGRKYAWNEASLNNDYCDPNVKLDVVVTDKGRDLLGLKLIDDSGDLVEELIGLDAPGCGFRLDASDPSKYIEVPMTTNGLGGKSGVYQVFIVRDGVRNKPSPVSNGQEVYPVSGYVYGKTVTNPIVFTDPVIDLSQADGTVKIPWERLDAGSPMGDCTTPISSAAFLPQGNPPPAGELGARLVLNTNLQSTDVNGYGYGNFKCESSADRGVNLRLAATTAGTLTDGLRLQGSVSTPSGTKLLYNELFDITANGTLELTPPEVDITPIDGATYNVGEVPALDYTCTDDPSSIADGAVGCKYNGGYSTEPGTHSIAVSSKSWGGTTDATATYTVVEAPVDEAPPVVTISGVEDGATYAFGSVPAADCSAVDEVDGSVACTFTGYSDEIGTHTVTGEATDAAGNTGTATATYVVEDQTAPVVTIAGINDGETYEYGTIPNVLCSATDDVDAMVECTVTGDSDLVGTHSVTGSATDTAGNTGTASATYTVEDTQAPDVVIRGVADGETYAQSEVPDATCEATDPVDGNVDCTVSGDSTQPGTHTVTASATDANGNTGSASVTYTVVEPAEFGPGFTGPIDMDAVNLGKANRSYPLMFNVSQGGAEVTDPAAVSLSVLQVPCEAVDALALGADELETSYSTELELAYVDGQFKAKMKIGKDGAGCYRLSAAMKDGSGGIQAYFDLTK